MAQQLAGCLAPPVCALCGGPGQWLDEPWGLDLCIHCEAACRRAPVEPLPFDAAFCLFQYRDPVDQMITRLKFQHELSFARVLGTLFARARRAADLPMPECLVPMPLHRGRYRERGFCQTTELARHIAWRLRDARGRRLPIRTGLLTRVRATSAQSGLSAADRGRNLLGAFAANAQGRPPRHVALLDDVLTTGHTATAAAAALRAIGVARVEIWCCARALRDNAGPDTAGTCPSPEPPWPPQTNASPPTPRHPAGSSTTS
ncbi:MAG: ComF family protein [Steroidobacteraceae bacterium]